MAGENAPRPLISISFVNLPPVPCIDHTYHELPVVYGVDNAIRANPESE